MTNIKIEFMAQALTLAKRGLYSTHPNPRVGCIITKGDTPVGKGYHLRTGEQHAEQMALSEAGPSAHNADVYTTMEPCAHKGRTESCAKMLIEARVRRAYIATIDPNPLVAGKGMAMLRQAGIEVETGILEGPARELNIGFIHRHELGRPWIRCKMATSLDGATRVPAQQNKWITAAPARQDVQLWRARSSAIISSAKSVAEDNARLNVRAELNTEGEIRQPLRVLLDSKLALNPSSLFFKTPGAKLWVGVEGSPKPSPMPAETEVILLPKTDRRKSGVCLKALIETLTRREINEILVEAGSTLVAAFFNESLADEIILYIAPRFLGTETQSMIASALNSKQPGATQNALQFEWKDVRFSGKDLRIMLRPIYSNTH